jgi:hypothetical protein
VSSTGSYWRASWKSDPRALELADRHYSRQTIGAHQVGGPGRSFVLVTDCGRALWLATWPEYPQDELDAYRCSIFRNEGAGLSSRLIREAMLRTEQAWGAPPPDGWVTWVDARRVRSTNPGYCFLRAGWWRDDDWAPFRGRRGRIRLRASALTDLPRSEQLALAVA